MKLHLRNAIDGFEGADEDSAADVGQFGADVEHEVIAVAEIYVRMATAEKHRAIAWSWSAKMMSGGVARRIGFGFDDAADKCGGGEFAHDELADEEARESDGIGGQLCAAQ